MDFYLSYLTQFYEFLIESNFYELFLYINISQSTLTDLEDFAIFNYKQIFFWYKSCYITIDTKQYINVYAKKKRES